MKKKFDFGKIAYGSCDRRFNRVTVEVELSRDRFDRPVFSAMGFIWNARGTDCLVGGQCLDEIAKYRCKHGKVMQNIGTFNFLYMMWQKYHLNDMHSGTPEQEEAIKKWKEAGNKYDYAEACKYLESIGLYEVEYHGLEFNGMYKYGHGWLYQPIDPDDLNRIIKVMESYPN